MMAVIRGWSMIRLSIPMDIRLAVLTRFLCCQAIRVSSSESMIIDYTVQQTEVIHGMTATMTIRCSTLWELTPKRWDITLKKMRFTMVKRMAAACGDPPIKERTGRC